MSREVIDYEGEAYCKFAEQQIKIIHVHSVYDDGSTGYARTRVFCPYFYLSGFTGANRCQKGGKCGFAE